MPTSSTLAATLIAATPEAVRALGGIGEVRVTSFPFKVGRESRTQAPVKETITELRLGNAPPLNDLYLLEQPWSDLMQISREHFAIEYLDGKFFLVDRGSALGTIVSGRQVGGNRRGGRTELRSGDAIVVGAETSEYIFRFEVSAEE